MVLAVSTVEGILGSIFSGLLIAAFLAPMAAEILGEIVKEVVRELPWAFPEGFRQRVLEESKKKALKAPNKSDEPRSDKGLWVVRDRVVKGQIQVYARRGKEELTFGDPIPIDSIDTREELIGAYTKAEQHLENAFPGQVKAKHYL